jgi:hypothetical protein
MGLHDFVEQFDRLIVGALERVATGDGAETTAERRLAVLLQHGIDARRLAAGEDNDATAVEGALDGFGQAAYRPTVPATAVGR